MITVLKAEIVSAMKACMPGIEKGKSDIQGSDSFTFQDGIVYSFNGEIAVSIPIPYPDLEGTIKADEALKIFSKLRTPEVEITIKKNYWEILSGNTKVKLKLLPEDAMEAIESLEIESSEMHEISPDFHRALSLCILFKNKTDFGGVAFNGDYAMSTDSTRMAYFKLTTPMPRFWLSDEACKFLKASAIIEEYRIDERWAHFKMDNGTYFSTRRISDIIYPFSELMSIYTFYKSADDVECNTFPSGMKDAVDRVTPLSGTMGTCPVIDVTFTQESIILKGIADAGECTERITLTEPFEEEMHIKATMTADFLKEATGKASKFYLVDGENCKALVVEGDQFLQISSSTIR